MKFLLMFYEKKDIVVSPTRYLKPISQVAENITVITADDIEAMNAHTVSEVLKWIPGLFISSNQDFGAASLVSIQGSEQRHVLFLVDDIPWNLPAEGSAETNSIPVGIIKRIEVIKGPASSAWGSSLGGVVNIITKSAGTTPKPSGSIRASYGKRESQDYRADISGRAGLVKYYLFAGAQDSDGLISSRSFDSNSLYSKFEVPVSKGVDVGLSLGYSDPKTEIGDFPSPIGDITQAALQRTFFANAFLNAVLNSELSLKSSIFHYKQKLVLKNETLGLGPNQLYLDSVFDEETTGAKGQLVWTHGRHTAVLGAEFDRGQLDQTIDAGPFLQASGVPAHAKTHPDRDQWAVYFNDTISVERWTLTPGIRYDHDSVTGSFVSPSLGVTYRLWADTILRASVARGFTTPPLSWTSGGGLFLDPNPDLDPEEVWSYQAGVESAAFEYVWIKATVFRHNLKKALTLVPGPLALNDLIVNRGKVRRKGIELEAETVPFYHFSLLAGFSFVDIDPANDDGSSNIYTYNMTIRYDDKQSFRAQVSGCYVWWDLDSVYEASYDDVIWDLNVNKQIWSKEQTALDIFFTAHNIFDGAQYPFLVNKNPGTWGEVGIRFRF